MSLASGRAARSIAPNSKQQALAKLAQLKQGGLKRTDQFAVCVPPVPRPWPVAETVALLMASQLLPAHAAVHIHLLRARLLHTRLLHACLRPGQRDHHAD